MDNRQNEKKNDNGFRTNEDIIGFTPRDGEVMKILKKYGHEMTLVIYMGSVDGAPAIGVKVAGNDPKAKESAKDLGDIFISYLEDQLIKYANRKNGSE